MWQQTRRGRVGSSVIVMAAAAVVVMSGCTGRPATALGEGLPQTRREAQAWTKSEAALSGPSSHLKRLAPLVGNWHWTSKWWLWPGASPTVIAGTATSDWIFGERWLKIDCTYAPEDGVSRNWWRLVAFDRASGKYQGGQIGDWNSWGTWGDGEWSGAINGVTFQWSLPNPTTGDWVTVRYELAIIDDNLHTWTAYRSGSGGRLIKVWESRFQRVR